MSVMINFWEKCCMPVKKVYRAYRTEVILRRDEKDHGLQIPRLTSAQKNEIDALYGKYGFDLTDKYYHWHHLLYAVTGITSPYFIDGALRDQIVERFNNVEFANAWGDKSFCDILCREVKTPYAVLRNLNGLFYDHNFKLITYEIASEIFDNEERVIVKPSINSCSGHNVRLYKNTSAEEVFGVYRKDFLVQRVIQQHPILAAFNLTSVNTLRIMSWYFDGEVYVFASILRVGKEGSVADNLGAGGLCLEIKEDGTVKPGGYDEYGRLVCNWQTDIAEKEIITIPAYNEVIDAIKKLHPKFPYFGIIAWDFTVDINNAPVLIEYNLKNPGIQTQFCHGPFFGKMSERILEEARKKIALSAMI